MKIFGSFKLSFIPPLMIYLAAGISGITNIVGLFFVKEYLDLSAVFLAGLGFWAGLPWVLKIPLGHLVDILWKFKSVIVLLGALVMASSSIIMYCLIQHKSGMLNILNAEQWFVLSSLLAPIGFVLQDVVADAMTVEAVPSVDEKGNYVDLKLLKAMNISMQMLGRIAIILGTLLVSFVNLIVFSDSSEMNELDKIQAYSKIYLYSLIVPLISISGIFIAYLNKKNKYKSLIKNGVNIEKAKKIVFPIPEIIKPNLLIIIGSIIFVFFTLTIGTSFSIILFLLFKLSNELDINSKKMLIGTAIVIFVFRAIPGVGQSGSWFEIDILKFDQEFLSLLGLIASTLTIIGIFVLRPLMEKASMTKLIIILSITGALFILPSIAMFYGFHNYTSTLTNGLIDARFIAVFNTAIESPLGQVSMIPILAWIAQSAPNHLKATFFAVLASFTNLALSASNLGTKYLNQFFIVTREVRNEIGEIKIQADYSDLGTLLIIVTLLTLIIPILTTYIIRKMKLISY
jgi:MFS family permease